MATEALKSTSITNSDAVPLVVNTIGEGGIGPLWIVNDTVVSTAGVLAGSTYKMVRIPTNAKVKNVILYCAAHGGACTFDIDVAHSDSTTDGTPASLQGNIVQLSAADNKLFGSAVTAVSAQTTGTVVTFTNTFTQANRNTPLWSVLVTAGATTFSADPGGFFDIVLKTVGTDTSGGMLAIDVEFVV